MKAPITYVAIGAGDIDGHRAWLSAGPTGDAIRGSVFCHADRIEAIQVCGTPDELDRLAQHLIDGAAEIRQLARDSINQQWALDHDQPGGADTSASAA